MAGRRCLPCPTRNSCDTAAARWQSPYSHQRYDLRPICFLGHLVAVRSSKHGICRAGVVRPPMPRRITFRDCEPSWFGSRTATLDTLERMAFRRLRAHDCVRAADQRLSIPETGDAHTRWLDSCSNHRRLSIRQQQARLVPLSVPCERSFRPVIETGSTPLSRRSSKLARLVEATRRTYSSVELRASRRDPDASEQFALSHVRPMFRLSQRGDVSQTLTEHGNCPRRR